MLTKTISYFRVKDWLHILGIPTLGFVYNSNFNLLSVEFVSVLILSSFGLAFAYSFDTNYDKFKTNIILLPSLLALIAALVYSSFLAITTFILALIGGLIVIVYVLPPFRLKGTPIAVTVLNSLGFSILFLIGYSILSDLNSNILLVAVFIAIASFPVQLVHEITHSQRDKEKMLITTPIKFGFKFTYFLISISLITLIIWSFFLYLYRLFSVIFPILSIGFSSPFYLILKFVKNVSRARLYIRYLSIILGLLLIALFVLKI